MFITAFEQGPEEGEGEVTWRSRELSSKRERGIRAQGIARPYGLDLCSDEKLWENSETPVTPFKIVCAV